MQSEDIETLTLRGDEKALRSLIEKRIYPPSSFPLNTAAGHGLLNIVKLFVEEAKCNINQKDLDNMTPLAMACWRNRHLVVQYLCSFQNIELNIKFTRAENTCLHIAAMYGYHDIVQCLLKYGAEKTLVNYYWRTAEDEALKRGYTDLASFISRFELGMAIKLKLKRQILEQDTYSEYHLSDISLIAVS
ncbi:hypothetical protein C9374_010333 [Naegleria lovaniensis]|uniref:Uncharacterized protein n=1 Tax=Naegleria lovaniensis TaxID=51637 RepID=A0AA88KG21_NAELO|nr:uncharacterized protein C9374_010333 [Naegleria lovaniensis]KAG2374959.1 hypothetical protein C9374_010333 [Naegleria lovaniensis]